VLKLLPTTDTRPACAVVEVTSSLNSDTQRHLVLKGVEDLDDAELNSDEDTSLCTIMRDESAPFGPFSRRGWLKEAQEWIQHTVPGVEFTADFRQYNAGDNFALVRLGIKGSRSCWLKATGEPNTHECGLTVKLADLFPEYLPVVVAVREDWNAWVTEDAGSSLSTVDKLEVLIDAVTALAELQTLSLPHVPQLEQAGCVDRTLGRVLNHLPEMITCLEEAMRNQTSTRVQPVAASRLREVGCIVEAACERMLKLDIPCALVNGDINLDNILYDGNRFRFVDWAEGGIGNPFLSFQQVIQHVIRDDQRLDWVPVLCAAYKAKWLALLAEQQIDVALALMPLLTMVDYLHGRGDWLNPFRGSDPMFQSFARTLTRCMDRAAAEPALLEALSR